MNIAGRIRTGAAALAAVACLYGCATIPSSPVFGLALVVQHQGDAVASSIPALYHLTNESDTRATGCLTNLYGYTFTQHRDLGAYAVVRPNCLRAFDLEPGAGIEWAHSIDLSEAPHDTQLVRGWVAVLTPGGCAGKACRRIDVRSPSVSIR